MSRIGKKKIIIPEKVDVKINSGGVITVKGDKGELSYKIRDEVNLLIEDKSIVVSVNEIKGSRLEPKAFWGLTRSLIFNMIKGVSVGYEKKLELVGVGYKAAMDGQGIKINVGYSHPVFVPKTDGITFKIEKNIIIVSGINKELVGQVAANIRKIRKPEPYKGKGIRYVNEIVKLKAGKKATK